MGWLAAALGIVGVAGAGFANAELANEPDSGITALPEPRKDGALPVERALALRRSVRDFSHAPLSLADAAQLLWAAQGISGPRGLRTAPSAGALYPLEIYLVAGAVDGIAGGTHHYDPQRHRLRAVAKGDAREAIAAVAVEQSWVATAPAILVVSAVLDRSERKYGRRAARYVHMEAGHAAQNVYLQAAALKLGTCMVGAFHDERLKQVLGLPAEVEVLAIMPVGHPG
jgi:SagB-type dehydrogenase family enzyme